MFRPIPIILAFTASAAAAQQVPDTSFDVSVARPAFGTPARAPRVVMDEAHNNFHTASGRYRPFVTLVRNDGFIVESGRQPFTRASLDRTDVLVIANALPPQRTMAEAGTEPAFTTAEAAALAEWVSNGGSLLLIADHAPFGGAAAILAERFGVTFGNGFVYDTVHWLTSMGTENLPGAASLLVFTRDANLLGTHAIMEGRDAGERIQRVVAFTGQSMAIPEGASVLLRLSPTAREASSRAVLRGGGGVPVSGRALGIALTHGRGRVVILGEAAMMSAQLAGGNPDTGQPPRPAGMNYPGTDDKQFVLNVMRWLARALP